MFSKKERVDKELFDQILKEGKALQGSFFVFKYLDNNISPHFSFVAPKKNNKKAITRNKLKRLGFNILKKHKKELPNVSGLFFYRKIDLKESDLIDRLEKDILNILSKVAK